MTKWRNWGAAVSAILIVSATACAKKEAAPLPAGAAEPANAAEPAAPALANPEARNITMQTPTYPLNTCVVCGESLGSKGAVKDVLHEGHLVRFCCEDCAAKFAAAPAPHLTKIDAAIVAAQLPTYPLGICPIEDAKLDAMGGPVNLVYGTRLVQLCCSDCEAAFQRNPAAALARVDAAYMDAQRPAYAANECPLMEGMAIDAMGEPFDFLYGTRLIRLCCDQCVEKFWENPEAAIAKIDGTKGTETSGG